MVGRRLFVKNPFKTVIRNTIKSVTAIWNKASQATYQMTMGRFQDIARYVKDIVDAVYETSQDIAEFSTKLANDLKDFIESLPTPSKLMNMAVDFVKEKLLSSDGLCVRPNCGGHINSGTEQDLVPKMEDMEILASHHTQRQRHARQSAHRPRAQISPPPTQPP